jgi:hypothetical protein
VRRAREAARRNGAELCSSQIDTKKRVFKRLPSLCELLLVSVFSVFGALSRGRKGPEAWKSFP